MNSSKEARLIVYDLTFSDGAQWRHSIEIGRPQVSTSEPQDLWTQLTFSKCQHCPLNEELNTHCPLAIALKPLLTGCKDRLSYDTVDVHVTWRGRRVLQRTSLQRALSSVMGAVCANSGCPYTTFLKPMLLFHQPLGDSEETLFRALGSYLVAQYLKSLKGHAADWKLDGLRQAYADLNQVNRSISQRIRLATEQDASSNSLILLDLLASEMLSLLDDYDGQLDDYFEQHVSGSK